jgi:hypothetical protein
MVDKVAACVRDVVAIAGGAGTVEERRGNSEQRIARLLQDAVVQTGGYHGVAQDLRDRLGSALNAEHDPGARDVLDKVIDYLREKIGLKN